MPEQAAGRSGFPVPSPARLSAVRAGVFLPRELPLLSLEHLCRRLGVALAKGRGLGWGAEGLPGQSHRLRGPPPRGHRADLKDQVGWGRPRAQTQDQTAQLSPARARRPPLTSFPCARQQSPPLPAPSPLWGDLRPLFKSSEGGGGVKAEFSALSARWSSDPRGWPCSLCPGLLPPWLAGDWGRQGGREPPWLLVQSCTAASHCWSTRGACTNPPLPFPTQCVRFRGTGVLWGCRTLNQESA